MNITRMGSPETSLTLLLATLLFLYWSTINFLSWRRLRHIPGPRWAALSKWWMLRNTLGGHMHLATKEACKQYGKGLFASVPSASNQFPALVILSLALIPATIPCVQGCFILGDSRMSLLFFPMQVTTQKLTD